MKRLCVVLLFSAAMSAAADAQLRRGIFAREQTTQVTVPVGTEATPATSGQKSVLVAVLSSLAVPGLGELYVGSFSEGRYHMAADVGLWIAYAGFKYHSIWMRDDARLYAGEHAGALFAGKDDQYIVNVSNYLSVDSYNEAKLRSREYDRVYNSSEYFWSWQTDEQRRHFRDMRVRSDQSNNDAKFVVAALVVNRIISAFSAGRAAARYNLSSAQEPSMSVAVSSAGGFLHADGITVHLAATF